jgi:hypothetical protein
VSRLEDVAAADAWRCWLCDEPVDPAMSVNDPRGPSVDSLTTKSKAKRSPSGDGKERLAHRGCNTRKGAVAAVVPWPERLFVADPAPILAAVERLARKGGREVMARSPTKTDGDVAGRPGVAPGPRLGRDDNGRIRRGSVAARPQDVGGPEGGGRTGDGRLRST